VDFLGNEKKDLQGTPRFLFLTLFGLWDFFAILHFFALLTKIKIKGKKSKSRAKEKE
jgi:hypothetical protein